MPNEKLTKLDPEQAEEVFADVEVEVTEMGMVKPPAGTKMSVAEARRVAKQAGLVGMEARKLAGLAEFGKFLQQQGIENIGGVYVAFTGEQLRSAIERATAAEDDLSHDPELQMRNRELLKEFFKLMIEAGKTMMKAGDAGPRGPHGGPANGFIPFPPGVAVQINNNSPQPTEVKIDS